MCKEFYLYNSFKSESKLITCTVDLVVKVLNAVHRHKWLKTGIYTMLLFLKAALLCLLQERSECGEERSDRPCGWAGVWERRSSGGAGGPETVQRQAGGEEQRAGGGAQKVSLRRISAIQTNGCFLCFFLSKACVFLSKQSPSWAGGSPSEDERGRWCKTDTTMSNFNSIL